MIGVPSQHRHIATLQKHWKADAMRDAQYNLLRARAERNAGNRVLANAYLQEYRWDMEWGSRRGGIVKKELRYSKG